MDKDLLKISPDAGFQSYLRTLYDVPYASEIAELVSAKRQLELIADNDLEERLQLTPLFEARFRGTDLVVQDFARRYKINQILELGAGLAPLGLSYTLRQPDLTYIEIDLPDIIETKKKIIKQLKPETPLGLEFVSADCLSAKELAEATKKLRPKAPVIIFNIGLFGYFDAKEQATMAKNVHAILSRFGGYWITPDPAMHNVRRREISRHFLTHLIAEQRAEPGQVKMREDNCFADEPDADRFFAEHHFSIHKRPQLANYKLISPSKLGLPKNQEEQTLKDLDRFGKIWILSAYTPSLDWDR
jgi:O-methyltransferase involved in polyketide biosynthesis